jgi:hypothetical protein
MPGNVRLRQGEAGLPRASVVNVSQIRTIDQTRLGDRLGVLGEARMRDVLKGLALLFGTDEVAGEKPRSTARHARRIRSTTSFVCPTLRLNGRRRAGPLKRASGQARPVSDWMAPVRGMRLITRRRALAAAAVLEIATGLGLMVEPAVVVRSRGCGMLLVATRRSTNATPEDRDSRAG